MLFSPVRSRLLAGLVIVGALFPTQAAAISIPIFPTDDDRGIDGLLDGTFLCCQLDAGQATVTLTTFEERAALEFRVGRHTNRRVHHFGDTDLVLSSSAAGGQHRSSSWTPGSRALEVDETRLVTEPASIVLVTTALAACGGRRRRAHSRLGDRNSWG